MSLNELYPSARPAGFVVRQASLNEHLSRTHIDIEYGNGDGKLKRWLELAALRGDGPPMVRLSARMVRYRRSDVEAWLASRTVRSTSEQPLGQGA